MTCLKRITRCGAALGLGLALASCTQFADVGPETVDAGYTTGGGEWSSGGGITVATRAFERNGVTVVCGAWTTDQQSALTTFLNDNVIETGSVYLADTRLVQNLAFMPRVQYAPNISGAPSKCVASGKPWRSEFASAPPSVRIPRLTFALDSGSRQVVTFRAVERPDIVH